GINPEYQKKIQELLLNLKKEGKTVLLIEHNSEFIGNISDKLLFLHKGKVTEFKNYHEFKENEFVKNAYI
ncbi:MAG: branched-chain amino acid ABC transporter ATP-binding protein, partial [bacterium]